MLLEKKRIKNESVGLAIRKESKQFLQLSIPLVSAQITQYLTVVNRRNHNYIILSA